jgi:hypothetical protein
VEAGSCFVSCFSAYAAVARLQDAYPCLVPVHLPVHASWLNQIEIYFSILERKVLTPPDVPTSCRRRREYITEYPSYST